MKLITLSLWLVLISAFLCCNSLAQSPAPAGSPGPRQTQIERISRLIDEGKTDAAQAAIETLLDIYPDAPQILALRDRLNPSNQAASARWRFSDFVVNKTMTQEEIDAKTRDVKTLTSELIALLKSKNIDAKTAEDLAGKWLSYALMSGSAAFSDELKDNLALAILHLTDYRGFFSGPLRMNADGTLPDGLTMSREAWLSKHKDMTFHEYFVGMTDAYLHTTSTGKTEPKDSRIVAEDRTVESVAPRPVPEPVPGDAVTVRDYVQVAKQRTDDQESTFKEDLRKKTEAIIASDPMWQSASKSDRLGAQFHMIFDTTKIWKASRGEKIAWKNVEYTHDNWISVAVTSEQWLEAYGHTTPEQWAKLHLERRLGKHQQFELPAAERSVLWYAEKFEMTESVKHVAEAVALADSLKMKPGEERDAYIETHARKAQRSTKQNEASP